MKLIPVAAFVFLVLMATAPNESDALIPAAIAIARLAVILGVKLATMSYYAVCKTVDVPPEIKCPSTVFGIGLTRAQAKKTARIYATIVGDSDCKEYVGNCLTFKFKKNKGK